MSLRTDEHRLIAPKEKHALLVGINTYRASKEFPRLSYAEADAGELAETLKRNCGFTCTVLLGPDATRDRLMAELEAPRAADLFLFFFAGHGEVIGDTYYLHPYDGRAGLGGRSVDFEELPRQWSSRELGFEHCVAILDACRLTLTPRGPLEARGLTPEATRNIEAAAKRFRRNVHVLYGCEHGQCCYEFPELGHGVLTGHLIQGAQVPRSDALTLQELVEETADLMSAWLGEHQCTLAQDPRWITKPTRWRIVLREGSGVEFEEAAPALSKPREHRVPRGMALVEGGRPLIGAAYAADAPRLSVHVPSFVLSKLVTVAEFGNFVSAGGYGQRDWWCDPGWAWVKKHGWEGPADWGNQKRSGDRPVVGCSWYEANAYLTWLSRHSPGEFRLPHEVEWEVAAAREASSEFFPDTRRYREWCDSPYTRGRDRVRVLEYLLRLSTAWPGQGTAVTVKGGPTPRHKRDAWHTHRDFLRATERRVDVAFRYVGRA